ncbi:gamma-glutamylcyclotransferase family protein, partial [Lamprobacter modestohalophilus]
MVIFVYGTLLRGLLRAHSLVTADFLGLARVQGTLYNLGAYPGLSEHGQGSVIGELYRVDTPTLAQLDRIEGFRSSDPEGSLYQRRAMAACMISSGETLTVETYVY